MQYEWGPKNPQDLFIKNCVFIRTCLSFSHLQITLHLMQYTYQDFFPQLKTICELVSFDAKAFSASAVFVSPLPHRQNVSL